MKATTEKHFILVLHLRREATPVMVENIIEKVAGGVIVEWIFMQEQRQVCKINILRNALKPLHDSLFATGFYKEIKLFEHVEW